MINHPNRKKILFTLQDVRNAGPCTDGWTKLLKALPPKSPLTTRITLGDVAQANDAADALWCIRVLDMSDIAIRRRVIAGAVLPAVTRVLKFTTDERVHNCVRAVSLWCDGDNSVDLRSAAAAAEAAGWRSAGWRSAAEAAGWRSAAEAERKLQRADIIGAFTPAVLLPL